MSDYVKKETNSLYKIAKVYAVIDTIISILMLIDNYVRVFHSAEPLAQYNSGLGPLLKTIFLLFSVIAFLKPRKWWYITINHTVISIFLFVTSDTIMLSSVLFISGWALAYSFGFFKTGFYQKTLCILFLGAVSIFVLYFAPNKMTSYSYTFVGASLLSFGLIFFLMKAATYLEKNETRILSSPIRIELADYNFSEYELYAIAATLRDETYYAISLHLQISESAVKKMMLEIYNKFECKNREIFLDTIGVCNVLYPRWFNPADFKPEPLPNLRQYSR